MSKTWTQDDWPRDAEFCELDDIPLDRDLFMLGDAHLDDLKREWVRYLAEPDGTRPEHPNERLDLRFCAIEDRGADSCDISVCINMITRFHGVTKKLPRSKFVACIHFWNWAKRRYLVVKQDWFDELERELLSLYGLVDAAEMRQLLEKQGRLETYQVERLRNGIDALAAQHRDHAFLTLTDSVLVKTNWSAREDGYEGTYRPEMFIDVLEKVRGVLRTALGLGSYAVVAQGANQLHQEELMHLSREKNHVFFGCLATPCANVL